MSLASHSIGDARRVVEAFRTAAERCTAFKDVEQPDFSYESVELQPDPGYGDESVFVRLVQVVASYPEGESLNVPYAVVVARQGNTVAMFTNFNRPEGANGEQRAGIPDDLVRAQLEKIAKLDAST
ncbi:hypothetical protein [Streptomyces sp. PSKA30]|uniref:hypothetical protein n=1 Tax=Streptomyces sp. PSKA30 TaxID=2874597 RepID=UPI001CD0CD1A|nr:hypothetical protein [Streptomyces sp. PSKA30]MBZ9644431.1 hypothetical protein [Streptomyces sp. PSKA30]